MKKFVEVPISAINNEILPQEAVVLARELLCEIRVVDKELIGINVKIEPEEAYIEYKDIAEYGYIWSVVAVNEFKAFTKNTKIKIMGDEFLPKILEKHKAIFKVRMSKKGEFNFSIYDNEELFKGSIEVI